MPAAIAGGWPAWVWATSGLASTLQNNIGIRAGHGDADRRLGDLNSGSGNIGLFNSGTGNVGFFNTGTGSFGLFNSGSFSTGIGNSGTKAVLGSSMPAISAPFITPGRTTRALQCR